MPYFYYPEGMKNYTPFIKPVPSLTIADICDGDRIVCVQFSADLLPYVTGALENLHWKDRFIGTPSEQEHSVGLVQDLVKAMAEGIVDKMTCCCGNGGVVTPTTAALNMQIALQLEALDDGTPESFAPSAPQYFDGEPANTPYANDDYVGALCQVVRDFMAAALSQMGAQYGLGATALGTIAALSWVVNPVLGAILSAVAVSVGLSVAAVQAALTDQQAIRNVVCCIQKGLKGREINQENLTNALANSNCDLTEVNEALIAQAFNTMVGNIENYRSFVRQLTSSLVAGSGDRACDCCDTENFFFDYRYFKGQYPAANETPPSYQWTGEHQITITTFYGNDSPNNPADTQRGFRIYAKEGCFFRVRIVSPTFTWGTEPNGYGVIWIDRGDEAGLDTDMSQFWCTYVLEIRWYGEGSSPMGFPADTPIVLEFDPDFAC